MARPYSVYPNNYDGNNQLPLAIDNVTPINAEIVNRLIDAIQAIEAELGIKPSGTYATVRARLDNIVSAGGGGTGSSSVIAAAVNTFTDGGSSVQTQQSTIVVPVNCVVDKIRLYTDSGIYSLSSGPGSQANIYVGTLTQYDRFYTSSDFKGASPTGLEYEGSMVDVYLNQQLSQGETLTISWINNAADVVGDLFVYLSYFVPVGL